MSYGNDSENKSSSNGLLTFIIGLALLALGIFLVFQNTSVSSGFYGWYIGGLHVPTGVISIPLFIGIIMLFCCKSRVLPWVVIIVGLAIIIVSIILSVHITFCRTSLLSYVIMFGCIMAGIGLLLRVFLRK